MAINWHVVNFDWNCARAFLVTVEQGSLSAAARALDLTQPTLSRQVQALEDELGVVLFERIGRGLELTTTGRDLYQYVIAMGEAANQLSLSASGKSTRLEGDISISCTDLFATFEIPGIVKELRNIHPGINIDIIASDDASDLKRREADIAIRSFRPTESDLIIRRLTKSKANLYATEEYLKSIGSPKSTKELANAIFLGFGKLNNNYMKALQGWGIPVDESNFSVRCNNHNAHWEMTKLGIGIGVMPIEIADYEPGVRPVFEDRIIYEGDTWLVTHSELRTNLRVRTVFDFLCERFID